jgi:hypothetical protein
MDAISEAPIEAALLTERVNPFKKFIEQSKIGFNKEQQQPTEPNGSLRQLPPPPLDENEAWVQCLDDQSGNLYWYNEVTGEARWAEAKQPEVATEETFSDGEGKQVASYNLDDANFGENPGQLPVVFTTPPLSLGENEAWVQYLDDESGYLYWYNEVTGEARWAETKQPEVATDQQLTDGEGKQVASYNLDDANFGENPVQLPTAPWVKCYHDDGNPYYYNQVRKSYASDECHCLTLTFVRWCRKLEYLNGKFQLEMSTLKAKLQTLSSIRQ